jgi:hypothetical protein
MSMKTKIYNTLCALSMASGVAVAATAASAQTTSECRDIVSMGASVVRADVYQACSNALAALDSPEPVQQPAAAARPAQQPAQEETASERSGQGNGLSASGQLTVTASALRRGRLDAGVCAGMTGGSVRVCSLVAVQTPSGPRNMLLARSGAVLVADVDIHGRQFLDLTAAAGGSGATVDADLRGHNLADVAVSRGGGGVSAGSSVDVGGVGVSVEASVGGLLN